MKKYIIICLSIVILTSTMSRAMECKLLSNDRYLVKELYTPKIYSKNIVHVLWKAEDIFLINDTNCQTIINSNQEGEIISQIDILPDEYPYIFHLDPPTGSSIWSFLDSQGNPIP